jgi:hypothetical protein
MARHRGFYGACGAIVGCSRDVRTADRVDEDGNRQIVGRSWIVHACGARES